VGGDLVEAAGQRPAYVELVGAPMRGEGGVEAVRKQLRGPGPLRALHRLVRETGSPDRLPGVRPAACERGRQPRSRAVVRGANEEVIELGRQAARLRSEQIDRRRAERGPGPPVEVVIGPAPDRRLAVQPGRDVSPTGRTGGIGAVEKIMYGRPVGHHDSL
jgi:hypothetical protein